MVVGCVIRGPISSETLRRVAETGAAQDAVSVASVGASRRHLRKSVPMDSIFTVSQGRTQSFGNGSLLTVWRAQTPEALPGLSFSLCHLLTFDLEKLT